MSAIVTAKVVGTVEMKNNDILTIDAPLVTIKPTMILPFGCKSVKGLVGPLTCSQLLSKCNCRTDRKSLDNRRSWPLALTGISALALEG